MCPKWYPFGGSDPFSLDHVTMGSVLSACA